MITKYRIAPLLEIRMVEIEIAIETANRLKHRAEELLLEMSDESLDPYHASDIQQLAKNVNAEFKRAFKAIHIGYSSRSKVVDILKPYMPAHLTNQDEYTSHTKGVRDAQIAQIIKIIRAIGAVEQTYINMLLFENW